jgi:hypothetical protein
MVVTYRLLWPALLLLIAVGCGGPTQLMPTPNVYVHDHSNPFADVPPALQTSGVDVLYITDREHKKGSTPDNAQYTYQRSRSL